MPEVESGAEPTREVVVLVHGTFAGAEGDEGAGWWQRESDFWNFLRDRLPQSIELRTTGRLFHWSGANSEAARVLAGDALLGELLQLETERVPYHIIAHSHGGNVMWRALRISYSATEQFRKLLRILKKNMPLILPAYGTEPRRLQYLRSWTTVGTPFLHLKPTRLSIVGMLAPFAPLVIALALMGLLYLLMGAERWARWDERPIFFVPIAIVVALALFPGLFGTLGRMRLDAEHETKMGRETMTFYGARWLGIWSADDEAINGLRTSVLLGRIPSRRIVPAIDPKSLRQAPFTNPAVNLYAIPYRWIGAMMYNRFVVPLGDRFIWSQVVRALQGNDRPLSRLDAVTPEPSAEIAPTPPLPEEIRRELRDGADTAATARVPEIRNLLGQAALGAGSEVLVAGAGTLVSGAELVHTSYFANARVRELILAHVLGASGDASAATIDPVSAEWVAGMKRDVASKLGG